MAASTERQSNELLEAFSSIAAASGRYATSDARTMVEEAGLSDVNAARLLMAHLSEEECLAEACANAIFASSQCEALCSELLKYVPDVSSKAACFSRVCALASPDHPVAGTRVWKSAPMFALFPGSEGNVALLDPDAVLPAADTHIMILVAANAPLTQYIFIEKVTYCNGKVMLKTQNTSLQDEAGVFISSFLFFSRLEV